MSFTSWLADGADWIDSHINPLHDMFGPSLNEQKKAEASGQMPSTASPGPLVPGMESVLSGMAWARDNLISHPLTTYILMARKSMGSWSTLPQDLPTLVDPNEWSKSWNASQHISPAQAVAYDSGKGSDADNGRALENAPLQYKQPAGLPQGFTQLPWQQQQDMLKNAGMPVEGNSLIEQQRKTSDLFKYGTGIGDFALSWWADPVVLGGKALGGVKTGLITQPITAGTNIDRLMSQSIMAKAQDYIYANKDNPQLLNNLSMAQSSALGPRFGAIASTLKTPEEVNLFLRVGLGDTKAMDQLTMVNAQAAQAIEQDTSRLAAMDLMHSRYSQFPGAQGLIEREMDRLSSRISDNTDMVTRYKQVLASGHLIDQINLTRNSFAKAEELTNVQNAYTAGAARRAGTLAGNEPPLRSFAFTNAPGSASQALQVPISDILPGGGQVASSRIYSSFFGTPLTVIRSFSEFRPSGHINVGSLDQQSVNELRGYVARIPGITAEDRGRMVNAYLAKTTEGDRANLLDSYERQALGAIAARHGLTSEEGDALYSAHQAKQNAEKAALQGNTQYSTVTMPGEAPGEKIRVDTFPDGTGALKVHPNLVSRLINDRQMLDLNLYDKILSRNSSALKALRVSGGNAADWVANSADLLNSAWKFTTLLRLGYIPRVLGDDLAGQVARLGAATMAARAGWGIKNAATNVARSYWRPFNDARIAVSQQGLDYANAELDDLMPQIKTLEGHDAGLRKMNMDALTRAQRRVDAAQQRVLNLPDDAPPALRAAATQLLDKHGEAMAQAQLAAQSGIRPGKLISLADLKLRQGFLERVRDLRQKEIDAATAEQQKAFQGALPVDISSKLQLPGALVGQRGQMYQELLSSEDALNTIFRSNKALVHGNLMRSWDHGAVPVSARADPAGHMAAWQHVINAQFGNDALARQALGGASVGDLTKWLTTTPEGIAYRERLGEGLTSAEDLARRVHYDVNEIAPTPEIRAQALTPEGVTADQLKKQFPILGTRPDVHRGQIAANLLGGNAQRQGLNKIMSAWFKWAAEIPADRMSRHPLFNQLYEGHARNIAESETAQGRDLVTANDAERIASQASQLALRDTRKLVFDIAHQTDAAAALKFISPFFSATTEAWQRWSRIIAEKPEVAGYAAKFFNAPLAQGVVQDKDGNPVDAEGYAYDPVTKTRNLVSKGDRHIVMRLPKFLVEGRNPIGVALGASPAGDINLSQDSMNLVLAGDPWFNPGQGPIVTIPVNEFVQDKPSDADLLQKIGVLPFGPSTNTTLTGRVFDQIAPRTIKDFLTSYDTTDSRYQAIKAQIMQRAAFEHATMGKPMPSAQEIADRTKDYWQFAAASAFLGPISGMGTDPYQFYRDEYNKMARATAQQPKDQFGRTVGPSADDQFLEKYGESYFVFAQQMTKNLSGAPATLKAAQLSKQYGNLIAQDPSLAALIIGPEGNGPFSPGAYAYQLNNPLVPGGAEMQRTRLSADEAMTENQKRLGWAKYTARMNDLNAQLTARGLSSFNDAGAQDLKQLKQGYTSLYSKPLMPDGTVNQYFNQAWADDFNSQNTQKYNERVAAMTSLVRSDLAKDPARTDLQTLGQYLGARAELNRQLAQRKADGGSLSLTSNNNSDLKDMWERTVDQLVQSDTTFGDLYHRYLSKDMQVDVIAALEAEGAISGSAQPGA